jgi:hypothetical protein
MTTAGTPAPVLDRRTLNRTLLTRQLLLERVRRSPLEVVEHLVGLQAQEPPDPYVALWSRIEAFDPRVLSRLLEDREAVRMGHLRGTLHLVSAGDALAHYPILADVMARSWRSSPFIRRLDGIDVDAVLARAREAVEERPRTPSELGAVLAEHWPDRDPTSLAYAARFLLPLVQVPPRGLWGRTGRPTNTTAEAWLGASMAEGPSVEDLVMRYLAVFGPATVGDMRVWSWLTGLREVVDRLRPRLRTYRDEAGRELFDVPDGPIAHPDLPAPVRFLPQYDNVFLSHEDRSRINGELSWGIEFGWKGPILIDGVIAAAWRVRRAGKTAVMTVELGRRLSPSERAELEGEATRLGTFLDPERTRELVIVEPG